MLYIIIMSFQLLNYGHQFLILLISHHIICFKVQIHNYPIIFLFYFDKNLKTSNIFWLTFA